MPGKAEFFILTKISPHEKHLVSNSVPALYILHKQ